MNKYKYNAYNRCTNFTKRKKTIMALKTVITRGSTKTPYVLPTIDNTKTANEKIQKEAAKKAERDVKTQGKPSPTLTSDRASITTPVISKKVKKAKERVITPNFNELYNRVFSTENLQIGSLALCAAAAAGAFGTWASKIGVLPASKIVATNLIAFLQPGMTVVGFALKAGMFITMNALVPLGTALVTISLPIISTIVVTTISVFVILAIFNKMIKKLEEGVKVGMDKAMELPGKLLEQVPGYSMMASLFGLDNPSPPEKKTEEPVVQKRQRTVIDLDEVKPRRVKKPPVDYTPTPRRDFFPNIQTNGE